MERGGGEGEGGDGALKYTCSYIHVYMYTRPDMRGGGRGEVRG